MQQPSSGEIKPTGQVFTNFDDLFAARTGGGFASPPPQTPPQTAFPVSTASPGQLIDFFSSPTPQQSQQPTGGLSSQSEALLSPRYTPAPTPQYVVPAPVGGIPYMTLISPRYVPTTTPTSGGFQQPLVPVQQQQPLGQPTMIHQIPQATPVQPSPALWNPFWEDMKDDGSTTPREEDDDVQVHVVKELPGDDSPDEADPTEQGDEKKYRNFQLRTSSHALANSEAPPKEKKGSKTKQPERALSKSKEQEPEEFAEIEYEHSESLHLGIGGIHLHRHHHLRFEDAESNEPIRFNWHPKKTASAKTMKALIQVNCLVKGDFEAPVRTYTFFFNFWRLS